MRRKLFIAVCLCCTAFVGCSVKEGNEKTASETELETKRAIQETEPETKRGIQETGMETESIVTETDPSMEADAKQESQGGNIPGETDHTESEAARMMKDVLLGKQTFIYTGEIYNPKDCILHAGDMVDFYTYLNSFYYDMDMENPMELSADSFVVVDLDGDEINEVILYYGYNPYAAIFHYEDGQVFLSGTSGRGIINVTVDGIYTGSSGASSVSYHRGKFIDGVLEDAFSIGFDGVTGEDYFMDGKEISGEQLQAWVVENYDHAEKCETYEFNSENIERYVK